MAVFPQRRGLTFSDGIPHLMNQYQDPRWKTKADKIRSRDNHKCQCCGAAGTQAHHLRYNIGGDIWDVPDEWLETLCDGCHEKRTNVDRLNRMRPTREVLGYKTAPECVTFTPCATPEPVFSSPQERTLLLEQVLKTVRSFFKPDEAGPIQTSAVYARAVRDLHITRERFLWALWILAETEAATLEVWPNETLWCRNPETVRCDGVPPWKA